MIALIPGQINVYHPDGTSRVINNPESQALNELLQDTRLDGVGAPLIVLNETNTHWKAAQGV